MSFEDAERELTSAMAADGEPTPLEQAPTSTTPEGTSTPDPVQPHHASTQPRDPSTGKFIRPDGSLSDTPEPVAQDTFDGGKFNPDTLAPELQVGWKQLQADYTRKMQEIAEQRKQFEGIDPMQARQAVELYQQLQDPDYLVQFHGELTRALEGQGLTNAEARAEAARITEDAATSPTGAADPFAALREDPELAPVADSLAALEKRNASLEERLNAFEQDRQLREQQEAIRLEQMAMAAELQRQEMAIKSANPHYTEEAPDGEVSDMDAIYALSAHTDGNLLAAQDLYERIGSMHIQRFIAQKTAVTPGATTPPGQNGVSEVPTEIADLDSGHNAALEYLRGADIDTIG